MLAVAVAIPGLAREVAPPVIKWWVEVSGQLIYLDRPLDAVVRAATLIEEPPAPAPTGPAPRRRRPSALTAGPEIR